MSITEVEEIVYKQNKLVEELRYINSKEHDENIKKLNKEVFEGIIKEVSKKVLQK